MATKVMRMRGRKPAPAQTAKPTRRKSCEHPSCPKQPAFSFNGSSVRFCAQHRLAGMVNVRNRRCEGMDCTKEPYFGEIGGKAKFCATHKPDEAMIDVRHRRCEFSSCHKQPNYGYEGQRACYCSTHKLPTMVDVKHRRCAEAGCRGYSSFAFPGTKKKFCAMHRRDGMVPAGRGRASATAAAAPAPASAGANTPPTDTGSQVGAGIGAVAATSKSSGLAPMVVACGSDGGDGPDTRGVRRRECFSEERGVGARISSDWARMMVDVNDGCDDSDGTTTAVGGIGDAYRNESARHHHAYQEEEKAMMGSSSDVLEWRRRSCPPDIGTAAKAYIAQQSSPLLRQQKQEATTGDGCSGAGIGARPLEVSTATQHLLHQPQQQRRRLEPSSGEHGCWKRHLVRSFSAGQQQFLNLEQQQQQQRPLSLPYAGQRQFLNLEQQQQQRPQSLPFPLTFREGTSPRTSPLSSSPSLMSFPVGKSSVENPEHSRQGTSIGEEGGGAPWPRAPFPDATAEFSSSSYGFGTAHNQGMGVNDASAASFSSNHQHLHRVGTPTGSGSASGGFTTAEGRNTAGATAHDGDSGMVMTTWADTALVSRKLPTVENLRSPPPTTADGTSTSVASLNPHWRSGMPDARKSVLFSFSGRTGAVSRNGGGGGVFARWPSLMPRRTEATAAVASAVVPPDMDTDAATRNAGGHVAGIAPASNAPRSLSSSSVVTLHDWRNNDARLAKLSSADHGTGGDLGPTLETLDLEFVGRRHRE